MVGGRKGGREGRRKGGREGGRKGGGRAAGKEAACQRMGKGREGGREDKDVPVPVAAMMISSFVSLLRRPMVAVGTWLSPQMT